MDANLNDDDLLGMEAEENRAAQAKMRHCLRCRTPFMSEWAGERICRKCKSTMAWRQG